MALINNIYIHVQEENIDRSSQIPQHPTETGLPLTDGVRMDPTTISISGKIVDTEQYTAATIISKLKTLQQKGSLVKYSGRNVSSNFMIQSFNTSHPNTNWGGADFDMELVEVRIAKSAYNPKTQQQQQQAAEKEKKVTAPTLKVGETVVFTGGPVYVSSDAEKAAANRNRSTCKITIINERSWSVHDYHLISTDGGKVYGWVDKSKIEGTGSSGTAGTTNAGTQQVKSK